MCRWLPSLLGGDRDDDDAAVGRDEDAHDERQGRRVQGSSRSRVPSKAGIDSYYYVRLLASDLQSMAACSFRASWTVSCTPPKLDLLDSSRYVSVSISSRDFLCLDGGVVTVAVAV